MKNFRLLVALTIASFAFSSDAFAKISGFKSPDRVELQAGTNVNVAIAIATAKDGVTLEAKDAWFGIVGNCNISKRNRREVLLWAEPNFTAKERTSALVATTSDGRRHEIVVSQPPYLSAPTSHTSARLMLQAGASHTGEWLSSGICSTLDRSGHLAVVATHGKSLVTGFTSGKSLTIEGLDNGDYLLFVMPNDKIAADALFDFCGTIGAGDAMAPTHFIVEYWNGEKWTPTNADKLRRTGLGEPYTFYNKYFRSAHFTTYMESFRLENAPADCVKVRIRTVRGGTGVTQIVARSAYVGMQLVHLPHVKEFRESHRVLFLGNSFTFYYGSPFMFKEIAASQGRFIDGVVSIKGGQKFAQHLVLERSLEAIERGGYDYAILQDTSPNAALYGDTHDQEVYKAARKINELTLKHSPNCKILYEHTWACPYKNYRGYGSYDRLNMLLYVGIYQLAKELDEVWGVSPIGAGFHRGRAENLQLLHRDNRHQCREGSYMKACINYLYIFGEPFDENVSNCGINPEIAAKIRRIAAETVAAARKAEQEGWSGNWEIWNQRQ